jgi:hypothetical protein
MIAPMSVLAALIIAMGVTSFFALRHQEPASSSTAVYENSGVITGTGPALVDLAARFNAYRSSGPVIGTGPGLSQIENSGAFGGRGSALAELARRLASYRDSGLIGGTGPSLAEFRGVDVIGISGTGPGLTQIPGNDSAKPQSSDTCRGVRRGPC